MLKKDKYAKSSETWCGTNQPNLSEEQADVVVFGIPFDEGVSYRAGAAEAPRMLRANTITSTPFTENFESFEAMTIFDGGDFIGENRQTLFSEVEEYVKKMVEKGVFFTMIGGDHSVTIPVQKGIDGALTEEFGIIHVDAHFDLCDDMGGERYSHGSVERRALDLKNINGLENLYFVGIRSIESDEFEFLKKKKAHIRSAKDCHQMGIEKVAEDVVNQMNKFSKIYLTIDIDCLDPAFAAGTGTPQLGGLYSRQLLTFLEIVFKKLNIIGFDIVEVAPPLDPSLTAMFAARRILTECWAHHGRKQGKVTEKITYL